MILGSAEASGRCLVCRAANCSCGPDTSHISPVDVPTEEVVMAGNLKTYEVVHRGVKTTMKLNEADARRYGVLKDEEPKATTVKKAAANKKRTTKSEG